MMVGSPCTRSTVDVSPVTHDGDAAPSECADRRQRATATIDSNCWRRIGEHRTNRRLATAATGGGAALGLDFLERHRAAADRLLDGAFPHDVAVTDDRHGRFPKFL